MKRPSLIQHFEMPPGYAGAFAWLCGYSADAPFLNDAAERFTGATKDRRAAAGRVCLAMLFDPGQSKIAWGDVPGLAHLPVKRLENLPFSLLHAKVALLGFRSLDMACGWRIRLIVSTGNWTTQTVEESLDLAWSIEVDSSELEQGGRSLQQRCADLSAAADMFNWLRPWFDERLLHAPMPNANGPTSQAIANVDRWLQECAEASGSSRTRFFDTRAADLLSQLPELIRTHAGGTRRSQLVMGSGFYEGQVTPGEVPEVLDAIVKRLQGGKLLTESAGVDLVVNEQGCQAIAEARQAIRRKKWKMHPPSRAEYLYGSGNKRSLHAKFLVSWNPKRNDPNRCTSGWVYLGSGNLTHPGFMRKAGRGQGNLEAGVVFPMGELLLTPNRRQLDEIALSHLLPYDPDLSLTDQDALVAGDGMPDRPPVWVAPPIAFLQWEPDGEHGRLVSQDAMPVDLELLDAQGLPCEGSPGKWRWLGACPPQACVRWQVGHSEAWIPVLDNYGRVAPLPLLPLALQDIAGFLESFPSIGITDADDEDTPGELVERSAHQGAQVAAKIGGYAVRLMMQLLDTIARKQVQVAPADWSAWCLRLEQVMVQAGDSPEVKAFRPLAFNPLEPLLAESFRPDFALVAGEEAAHLYEQTVGRIAQAWRVEAPKLGVAQ